MAGSVLEHALRLAERDIAIFPAQRNKRPATAHWKSDATTDEEQIRKWFNNEAHLLAVPTGMDNGLFALDIDPAGQGWLKENFDRLLCERVHQTKRGQHFLYSFPSDAPDLATNTAGRIAPGVDTRGEGGYVIWWAAHGKEAVGDIDDLSLPPQWLLDDLAAARRPAAEKMPRAGLIKEGGRNSALTSHCGRVWSRGATKDDLLTKAKLFNRQNNDPPLPEREVQTVVNSISRYKQGAGELVETADTEDDLALTFAKHNVNLRYVGFWSRWMQWNGVVWEEDSTLCVFDLIRRHLRAHAPPTKLYRKANTVAAIERLAKSDRRYAATPEQWDADDHLLNTPAGIVDLRSGALRRSDPLRFMKKVTKVGAVGLAPRWQQFLLEVTDRDVDFQHFLQRVIGYAATGFTHEHALFFLYGTGSNGKGVFLNTIQSVMGDYAMVASMETFTESRFDRHPTDLAMLQGARLVFAQETESGRAWAESRIKALTGGDPITARYMRQDFFTYEPKFKLLIAGNHKPRLRNVDVAMRRRLHLLPFTRTFSAKDRDPHLADTLRDEHGGILQWIVDGAVAYQQQGLAPPEVVVAATDEYFENEDLFQQWLADCCDLAPNA